MTVPILLCTKFKIFIVKMQLVSLYTIQETCQVGVYRKPVKSVNKENLGTRLK